MKLGQYKIRHVYETNENVSARELVTFFQGVEYVTPGIRVDCEITPAGKVYVTFDLDPGTSELPLYAAEMVFGVLPGSPWGEDPNDLVSG